MLALLNRKAYSLHDLDRKKWTPVAAEKGKGDVVAFIDGGNASLISTPSAELQRIRTAVAVVTEGRLAAVRQKEGYVMVRAAVESGKVSYVAELFDSSLELHLEGSRIAFDGLEAAGAENALAKVAETVRRLAEIAAATQAVSELTSKHEGKQAFAVLDGTLETFGGKESRAMADLEAAAKEKGTVLGSVAKTCALLADDGEPLIAAVGKIAEGKEGYIRIAEGLGERHRAAIAIAKLNTSANYLFRIETANSSEIGKLVAALTLQSNDLAFPGYPYGLIMADRFARISENDTEITKSKIAATANSEMKELLRQEKALDAHRILDTM